MTVPEYNDCVEKYSDNLYRFALKSLRDGDLAQDVVQDSFMKLWENRDLVICGKGKSYLFTVGYHNIVNNVRHAAKYASSESIPGNYGHKENNGVIDLNEILNVFLDKLPPIQKYVVILRDYEGYSYREIAEITMLTEAQVKINIFRARGNLKKYIGDINHIL